MHFGPGKDKDYVCRENSLEEGRSNKIKSVFTKKKGKNLPLRVPIKPSSPFYLNQRPTPYSLLASILSPVKDQNKNFLRAEVGTS